MKAIGIIGAMDEELTALKTKVRITDIVEAAGNTYYIGAMSGKMAVVVKSGIGKVNAAVCAQMLINLFDVECIINIGVAGSLDKSLDIGDVVISEDAVHHDFDSVIFNLPQGVIPRMEESFFKADQWLITLAKETASTVLKGNKILVGRIASGDQFIAANDTKEKIRKSFDALCVEMEGAAIAQTAYLNKIPFVIIRAISDNADDSAEISFEKFLEEASHKAANIVENIVDKL